MNGVDEGHTSFRRSAVGLLLVAGKAGRNEVVGGRTTTSGLGNHVVNSVGLLATVLADVLIPLKNAPVPLSELQFSILDGLHPRIEDANEVMNVLNLVEGSASPSIEVEGLSPFSSKSLQSMSAAHSHHRKEVLVNGDDLIPQSLFVESFTATHHGCTFVVSIHSP